MTNLRKSALTVAIASSLALVGCGGGGSSSSGGGSGNGDGGGGDSFQQTSVTGSAIKGVLRQAPVTVFEVTDDGEVRVGEARTDDAGEYTVILNDSYSGGLLRVMAGADDQTVMICDASQCGKDADGNQILKGEAVSQLSGSFELSALAEPSENDTATEASLSAWSTMAARRAATLGGDLRTASRRANAEVSEVAGFDIARTRVRAVTEDIGMASEQEQVSAVMNAVVAEMLFSDQSSEDLAAKLEKFAKALNDGSVGNSDEEYSISELAETVREVVDSSSGLSGSAKDLVNNQVAVYEDAADGDDGLKPAYDPDQEVAEDASQDEKIEKFTNFVTGTKSWVQSIEALDSDGLGAVVDMDVDVAESALRGIHEGQLQFVGDVIEAILRELSDNPELVSELVSNGGSHEFDFRNDQGDSLADAVLTATSDEGLSLEVDGNVHLAGSTSVPFSLQLNTSIASADLDTNPEVIKRLHSQNVITVSGTVGDENTDRLTLNGLRAELMLAKPVDASESGEIANEELIGAFVSASLSGEIKAASASGNRFEGEVSAELVKLSEAGRLNQGLMSEPVSLKRARVAGEFFSANGNSFRSSLTFNLNNASTFDSLAWAEYSNSSVWTDVPLPFTDVELLFGDGDVDPESYRTFVQVYEYSEADESVYQLHVTDYKPSNELKTAVRELAEPEVSDTVEAIRTHFREDVFTQSSIEFEGFDDVTGQPVQFEVSVVDLFNGSMELYGYATDPDMVDINVNIMRNESLLPAGISSASSTGESPLPIHIYPGWDGGQYTSFSAFGNIQEQPTAPVSEALTALIPEQALSLAESYSFSEQYGYGNIGYSIESSAENFSACIAAPASYLKVEGAGRSDCGEAILQSYQTANRELNSQEVEFVEAMREDALVTRFGSNLASQLTPNVTNIIANKRQGATSGVGDSYLTMNLAFPDLETVDNFADFSVTLNAVASIAEQPSATVTATVSRTSYRGGNALANVRWDGGNYSVALQTDDIENPNSYTGRIFNTQGYELTVEVSVDDMGDITAVSGDALLNGEDIGDLELRDNGMVLLVFPNGDSNEIVSLL